LLRVKISEHTVIVKFSVHSVCVSLVLRQRIVESTVMSLTRVFEHNPNETRQNMDHQMVATGIADDAKCNTLHSDQTELERLPDKQTELFVNDEILKDVLHNLEIYLQANAEEVTFLAAIFKSDQMKTSPLSSAIIEAALTMIIDRMNNENMEDDEQYARLKQLSLSISYTDESKLYKRGVREFHMRRKENGLSDNQ
jgi:hypothetical protein